MAFSARKRQKLSDGLVDEKERCTFCNKGISNEGLIECGDCGKRMHPSCQELPRSMLEIIQTYSWQCGVCKQCTICHGKGNEELMLLCDHCDRGYHRYCLHSKEDTKETMEGDWICPVCKIPEPPVTVVQDDSPEYDIVTAVSPPKSETKSSTKARRKTNRSPRRTPVKTPSKQENTPSTKKVTTTASKTLEKLKPTSPVNRRHSQRWTQNSSPTVSPVGTIGRSNEKPATSSSDESVKKTSRRSSSRQLFETPEKVASCSMKSSDESEIDVSGQRKASKGHRKSPQKSDKKSVTKISPEPVETPVKRTETIHDISKSPGANNRSSPRHTKKPMSAEGGQRSNSSSSRGSRRYSKDRELSTDENNEVFKSPIKTYLLKRTISPVKAPNWAQPQAKHRVDRSSSSSSSSKSWVNRRRKTRSHSDFSSSGIDTSNAESSQDDTATTTEDERDVDLSLIWVESEVCVSSEAVSSPSGRSRKRRSAPSCTDSDDATPKKNSKGSKPPRCPTKGCDGSGNVDSRYSTHHTALGCPRVKFIRRKSKTKVMILEPEVEDSSESDAKKDSEFDSQRKCYPKRERKFLPEATLYGSCPDLVGAPNIRNAMDFTMLEDKSSVTEQKKMLKKDNKKEILKEPSKEVKKETKKTKKTEETKSVKKEVKKEEVNRKSSPLKHMSPSKSPKLKQKSQVEKTPIATPSRKRDTKLEPLKSIPRSQKRERLNSRLKSDVKERLSDVTPSSPNCTTPKRPSSPLIGKDDDSEFDIKAIITPLDISLFEGAKRKAQENLEPETDDIDDSCIKTIDFGPYEIDTWYVSPYPREYSKLRKLYVCEFCLKYMKSSTILRRHMAKCVIQHPPGDEVYRKGKISVFEVDGERSKTYCQNLCLLAKLFLDHKTLYYEVGPFLFYVMTEADERGCHLIGYFSKEKSSFLNYNVACILVMPHYMKKGYGRWLIDFSYLLSQRENKIGTPEHPLSDLGLISYRKYWTDVVLRYLSDFHETSISIKEISQKTSIHPNDIVSTLQSLGMVKYWKGKHLVQSKKDLIDEHMTKWEDRKRKCNEVDPIYLQWVPKVFAHENAKGPSK